MSHDHADPNVPRPVLYAAAGIMALSIGLAYAGRQMGVGVVRFEDTREVASALLRFVDRPDGAVVVVDARTGAEVTVVPPASNGFVRGVLRGLGRTRKLESLGPDGAFRLVRWADGRLSIEDPETHRSVDFGAFGTTNAQAFVAIFDASQRPEARR